MSRLLACVLLLTFLIPATARSQWTVLWSAQNVSLPYETYGYSGSHRFVQDFDEDGTKEIVCATSPCRCTVLDATTGLEKYAFDVPSACDGVFLFLENLDSDPEDEILVEWTTQPGNIENLTVIDGHPSPPPGNQISPRPESAAGYGLLWSTTDPLVRYYWVDVYTSPNPSKLS